MVKAVEGGVILNFDEIKILLHSMGIRAVEGIFIPEKSFSETEIVMALHHMSERGLIKAVDTEFSIREDLMEMLRIIGKPDGTMIWKQEDTGGFEYFFYITPNQVVVSERYWKKKDALKLRLFTANTFELWREQVMEGAGHL